MRAVFKVQRPLGGDMGSCLVYDETRTCAATIPYDATWKKCFRLLGDPQKLFVLADVDVGPDGVERFTVVDLVDDEDW